MGSRLPKTVTVGPYRYTVSTDADELNFYSVRAEAELVGHHDGPLTKITLDGRQTPDSLAATLLHEVMHALFYASGLDNRTPDSREEDIIQTLSPLLLDVLRRNPSLVAYLTGA